MQQPQMIAQRASACGLALLQGAAKRAGGSRRPARFVCLPIVESQEPERLTPPLIAAVVAPVEVLQAVGSGGWKRSRPVAESPANRSVAIVKVVGSPSCAFTAVSVTPGTTFPDRLTAASAPVVEYDATVCVPSAHVISAVPLVVLLPQPPLPAGIGLGRSPYPWRPFSSF